MIEISGPEDIAALKESSDVGCKLAKGRDGKGACPKGLWDTYSAFANTQDGDIFWGLEEDKHGKFSLVGIQDTGKVIDEIWSSVNDSTLLSANVSLDGSTRCIKHAFFDSNNNWSK
ncbi:RNA-binding domain-containing protein [uncultured Microbulbifer sp.]|uniref:AlbA family DNA-binding domain-containing protein n=1 Tax=uncultured Microbulbifer sp. TaxID=348147 RepID=UPI00262ACB82|nr:RNA-binding domain-containing protein [uncultured Microbulbifer sp.]